MAKIVALAAYFYQAAVAFGLLITVAHMLSPGDFSRYSLFISVSQFTAIFCFEWIRFACSRFYPGRTQQSEASERRALTIEFAVSAAFCILAAAVSIIFAVPPTVALLGGLVAVFQGASDLHLTILRFKQQFRSFSRLQGSRATILAAGTLSGTALSPTFGYTAAGLLVGYIVYSLIAILATRNRLTEGADFEPALVRKHFVYGSVAAGAAVVAMLAPLSLKSILTAMLGTEGAAGVLLALDLLQRPFVLIVSALQAIQYPDIVSLYDREGETSGLRRRLGEYYSLLTGFTLMTASGIFALLQPIGHFVIAPGLQQSFLAAAPYVTGVAVCRALTQNMLPTPSHLRHHLKSIFLLSLVDCLLLNGGVLAAGHFILNRGDVLMGGGMIGAILAMLIGIKVLVALPFDLIWQPVAFSAVGIAIPVIATAGFNYNLWVFVGIGVVGGGAFCLLGLHSFFIRMFRPQTAS